MDELQRLLAERDCARLCADYAYLADSGNAALAQLFVDDGLLSVDGREFRGRIDIARMIGRRGPTRVSRHLCVNLRIDLEGSDAASATSDVLAYGKEGTDGRVVTAELWPRGLGSYRDRFLRTPQGWRFAERDYRSVFLRRPPRGSADDHQGGT